MTGAPALLTRDRAGRLEPTRLGVRSVEATAGDDPLALDVTPLREGESRFGSAIVSVRLEVRDAVAHAHVSVRNAGDRPLRLDAVVLGFAWRGHEQGALRFLRHGWQSWSYTGARDLDAQGEPAFPSGPWLRGLHHAQGTPPEDRGGWHESALVTAVGAAGDGPACVVGAYERGRSFCLVYARREGDAVLLEAELRPEVVLAPGDECPLEPVRLALGDDASVLLEAYADDYGRDAGARTARPFMAGWCSWYWAFHDVTEDDVLRNLGQLAARREEIPVEVVQLDDGYQRAVGDWLETNEKFPRGLAPLAAEIRDAGFTPGLWTAPFCVVGESELFGKHPEWLLRAPGGEALRGLLHPAWAADASVYAFDTTRPDVIAHLERTFRELVDMGWLYLKLDFLYVAALAARASDDRIGRAARLRRGLEAVRAGAGEEAFLLGCGCPLGAAVGVVDGMRIGPDVAPRWDLDPAAAIPGIEATQPATHSALRSVLTRTWMHRRLWLNDPDCLLARGSDTQLTRAERETLAAVIAGTGGMAFVSDDLDRVSAEDRALMRATIETARAVDGSGIPGVARAEVLLPGSMPERVVARDSLGSYGTRLNLSETGCAASVPRGADVAIGDASHLDSHGAALWREARPFSLAVFCDFDGTFSVQDVGATLAVRHAPERRPAMWARYERGEITPWEYNLEILDGLPLPLAELERFLAEEIDLDPGARALLAWCEEHSVPFRILSDGFDWNLNRLQVLNRVSFAYAANHLRYEHGRWRLRAGHPDAACGCGTGTCKRSILQAFRAQHPGATLVHIGNGRVSDTCGALEADLAFAKDSLAPELERRGAAFEPFETLHDVIPVLDTRLATLAPRG